MRATNQTYLNLLTPIEVYENACGIKSTWKYQCFRYELRKCVRNKLV